MAKKVGNSGNANSGREDETQKDVAAKKKAIKETASEVLSTYGELDIAKDLMKKVTKTFDNVKTQPKDKAIKSLNSLEKDVEKRQKELQQELAEVQARNNLIKKRLSQKEKKQLAEEKKALETTIEKWHKSTMQAMKDGKIGDMTGSKAIARDLKKDGYLMLPNKKTLQAYGFPTPKEAKELEDKLKLLGTQLNPKQSKEKEEQLKKQDKDLSKLLEDLSKIKDSLEKGVNLENNQEKNKGLENKAYLGRNFKITVKYSQLDNSGAVDNFSEEFIIAGEDMLRMDSKIAELERNGVKAVDIPKVLHSMYAHEFMPKNSNGAAPVAIFEAIAAGVKGRTNGNSNIYTHIPTTLTKGGDIKDDSIEMSATDLQKEEIKSEIESKVNQGEISEEEAEDLKEKVEQGKIEEAQDIIDDEKTETMIDLFIKGYQETASIINKEDEDKFVKPLIDNPKVQLNIPKGATLKVKGTLEDMKKSSRKLPPHLSEKLNRIKEARRKQLQEQKNLFTISNQRDSDEWTPKQRKQEEQRLKEFVEDSNVYHLARKELEKAGLSSMEIDEETLDAKADEIRKKIAVKTKNQSEVQEKKEETVIEKQIKELDEATLYSKARKNLENQGLSSMEIDDETLDAEVDKIRNEMKKEQKPESLENTDEIKSDETKSSSKNMKASVKVGSLKSKMLGKNASTAKVSKEELAAAKKEMNNSNLAETKVEDPENKKEESLKEESEKTSFRSQNENEQDGVFTLEDATVAPQKEQIIEGPEKEKGKSNDQEMTLDEAIAKLVNEGKDVSDMIKFLDENEITDQPTRSASIRTFKDLVNNKDQGKDASLEDVGPELKKH